MNCRNRSLALCLAHTLKKCGELESLDKRFTFVTEVIRIQFGDATRICNCKVDNLKPLKTLKTCTKQWLTHGDTSAHVVSRFKKVVYAPDILTTEKHKTIAQILEVKCYLLSPFYCRFCLLEHLCLSIIFVCRDREI